MLLFGTFVHLANYGYCAVSLTYQSEQFSLALANCTPAEMNGSLLKAIVRI